MFRFTAKEEKFFDLFVETAKNTNKAATMLQDLMTNYDDVQQKVKNIEDMEHECDHVVHEIYKQLYQSFITPIDREDIHLIAKELDNIVDEIEAAAHRFTMFNVKSVRQDAIRVGEIIVKSTKILEEVMIELKNMKKSTTLKEKVIEINRLENEGDNIFRDAIVNMFSSETDAIEIIKWKEIFEYLENTLDACENVANIVEGVVMKHV